MSILRTQGHKRFRELVDALGSQGAAAMQLGCSQANVSNIYRGEQQPRMDLLVRIREKSADLPGGPIAIDEWAVALSADDDAAIFGTTANPAETSAA